MIKVVAVDDDKVFLERFCKVLQEIMAKEKVDFCLDVVTDPRKILEDKKEYDLYFFDIVMPEITGIELARKLRNMGNNKEFVFVSSHEQYTRASMVVRPCGFVRKLYLEKDLREVFLHLRPLLTSKGTEVTLKSNKKDYSVQTSEVMSINSDGHYLRLMYADGKEEWIRNSMKVVEEEFQRFAFLRVSNRCMINLLYLESAHKNEVFLKNGHKEKITGKYLKEASVVLSNWQETHKN